MTDKEFMEMLVLFQDGKVPVIEVGLALANNKFSPELLTLANNILVARKEKSKVGRPESISRDVKETIVKLRNEGMALEAIAYQVKCSLSTVRRTLDKYQQVFE